jgi:hypothetical protein
MKMPASVNLSGSVVRDYIAAFGDCEIVAWLRKTTVSITGLKLESGNKPLIRPICMVENECNITSKRGWCEVGRILVHKYC